MPTAVQHRSSRSLTKLAATFGTSNLISTLLQLVGGLLTTMAVGPAVLGTFNSVGLVLGYAPLLELGALHGLRRELPFYIGKGDTKRSHELVASAQGWMWMITAVALLVVVILAAFFALKGQFQRAVGLAAFIIPVVGTLMGRLYVGSLFRTSSDFKRLSWINISIAAIGLPLVGLVWLFGYHGLCLRITLLWLFSGAIFYALRPIRVHPALRWADLRVLFSTGIPIFIVGHLFAWWPTLNATLVLAYGGERLLGLYAVANMAGPIATTFPLALASVVYPQMAQQYGKTGDVRSLANLAIRPTLLTLGLTAIMVLVGWIAIPWFVRWFLPKYVEGICAAQWTVASALIVGLSPINNVFNVLKKQGRYGFAMLVGMLSYYVSLRFLVRDSVTLEAFPQAMLIGRATFMLFCGVMVWHLVRTAPVVNNTQ